MSATLVLGWEIPEWAGGFYEPVDNDEEEGRDIEGILDFSNLLGMYRSNVGSHTPDVWVVGFRSTELTVEPGNMCKFIFLPDFPSQDTISEAVKLTVDLNIPMSFPYLRWYLLAWDDY